jgi:cell division topological specificity factor
MSFLRKLLGSSKPTTSATTAKERLQIIVSHERMQRRSPDFLPLLQKELINVIAKYVEINEEQVKVALEHVGDRSVLELNIALPELITPNMNFDSQMKKTALEAEKTTASVTPIKKSEVEDSMA